MILLLYPCATMEAPISRDSAIATYKGI